MTWYPIWTTVIKSKFMLFPHSVAVITSLSAGLYVLSTYGDHNKELLEKSLKEEEVEMNRWSSSLQDPKSPNYQPFLFKKN